MKFLNITKYKFFKQKIHKISFKIKHSDEFYKMASISGGFCVIINMLDIDDMDEIERNDSLKMLI